MTTNTGNILVKLLLVLVIGIIIFFALTAYVYDLGCYNNNPQDPKCWPKITLRGL